MNQIESRCISEEMLRYDDTRGVVVCCNEHLRLEYLPDNLLKHEMCVCVCVYGCVSLHRR